MTQRDSEGPARQAAVFDPDQPYRRSPSVALRPESFGALAYHFGTRKLSFLKTPQLVEVVTSLDQHRCVHAAIEAAGVVEEQRPAYLRALAGLAEAGTIEAVEDPLAGSSIGTEVPLAGSSIGTEDPLAGSSIGAATPEI